jgi:hypothetical protein
MAFGIVNRNRTERPAVETGRELPPGKNNTQQNHNMEQRIIREGVSFDHSLVFANTNTADIPATSTRDDDDEISWKAPPKQELHQKQSAPVRR